MQWLIWLVVLLAAALGGELFHICRQRRELDRLSKSVEHFLLYPEDDIEETLERRRCCESSKRIFRAYGTVFAHACRFRAS